jgi:hypothetical protein
MDLRTCSSGAKIITRGETLEGLSRSSLYFSNFEPYLFSLLAIDLLVAATVRWASVILSPFRVR